MNLPELELKILQWWKENNIFEKSVEKLSTKGDFVFYEGPPTANGKPGIHHVISRAFKDIVPRFKTMRGYRVVRKGGWDTHGLPVELEVEKELGLKNKKEVEAYGIAAFNKKCKESVWKYKAEWEKFTERMAFWLDLKNAFITYEGSYVNALWGVIKKIWERGLLIEGHKVVPHCPRCGTALSSHELAQGYETVKDASLTVKFKVQNSKFKIDGDLYILSWTTTPWTLPGNVGLAVGKDIEYVVVKQKSAQLSGLLRDSFAPGEERMACHPNTTSTLTHAQDSVKGDLSEKILSKQADAAGGEGSRTPGTEVTNPIPSPEHPRDNSQPVEGLYQGYIILAKERLSVFEGEHEVIQELKGSELVGLEYEPLFDVPALRSPTSYKVYAADFVSTTDGTGVVHTAVMYGEDDYQLGSSVGLPKVHTVNEDGTFVEVKSQKSKVKSEESDDNFFSTLAGRFVKDPETERLIIEYLENKGLVFKKGLYEHDYPFCWRCKTPLLYYAKQSWFVAMSKLRQELLDANNQINWVPDYIKEGRFGEWLREVKDWAFSRERYWGTPLPIWKCTLSVIARSEATKQSPGDRHASQGSARDDIDGCGRTEVIGSVAELVQKAKLKDDSYLRDQSGALDLHRPRVDEVEWPCACGGVMRRVPEVADVWFDSGAMPFAQYLENVSALETSPTPPSQGGDIGVVLPLRRGGEGGVLKQFPADYISEAIDQTRGWFYTLLAVSVALGKGTPYKNVICLGHILDAKGKKMSKSLGNIVVPGEMFDKYGADAVRWYLYTMNDPGLPKRFDEKELNEVVKKFFMILWNVVSFHELYPPTQVTSYKLQVTSLHVLDRWILARLNQLTKLVTERLNAYDITPAGRAIQEFVTDLSTWYVRRSRERMKGGVSGKLQVTSYKLQDDSENAHATLRYVLIELSKLLAPFVPFTAEALWQKLQVTSYKLQVSSESVHLSEWPEVQTVDQGVLTNMDSVRKIVEAGLAARAAAKMPIRQPLAKATVTGQALKLSDEYNEILKDELNIKSVAFSPSQEQMNVILDTQLTEELKLEGMKRELIRAVNNLRKEAKLTIKDRIQLQIKETPETQKLLQNFKDELLQATLSHEIKAVTAVNTAHTATITLEGKNTAFGFEV